jgi:RimJ/RimL family protein N-acetyltransferase
MIPDVLLPTARGFLRPIDCIDLHQGYVDGLNDPDVNRYLEVRRERQTTELVANFVASNIQSSDSVLFGIFDCDNPSHIGTVRLHDINKLPGHCHIGICIFDKTLWGFGIGSDAIKNVTCWAFLALDLHRIEAHAYLDNVSSIRSFEKAGYRRISDAYKSLCYEVASLRHAVLVADR